MVQTKAEEEAPAAGAPPLLLLGRNLLNKCSFHCVRGKERHRAAWPGGPPCSGVVFTALPVSPVQQEPPGLIQHSLPGSATGWLLEDETGRQMLLLRFQSFGGHALHEIHGPQVFLNSRQDGCVTTGRRPSSWAGPCGQ